MKREKIEKYIKLAMNEAGKGIEESNSPFGAVILDKNENIISSAHNITKITFNPIDHAEIIAIKKATEKLKTRNLDGYILVTNAEPCAMCTLAAIKSGIKEIYSGAFDKKVLDTKLKAQDIINSSVEKINFIGGILEEETNKQILRGRKK